MEVVKCKFIMITKPVKKHWSFFLFLLGSFLRVLTPDIFSNSMPNESKPNPKDEQISNDKIFRFELTQKYFELIRNISSDLLIGVFHCAHKWRNKDEPKKPSQERYKRNSQKIVFIFNDEEDKLPAMYKIIFIISFVDIICQLLLPTYILLYYIFKEENLNLDIEPSDLYCLLFFDIFARYFFSRYILKTYFYKHHYLSFILNIIGLIPIAYINIKTKLKKNVEYILFAIIASIQLILYSFEDILNKVAFRTLYILPNTLIFYKGLVQLIYFIIVSALFFGFNLHCFSKDYDYGFEIRQFICFVPFNILRTIFLVRVIDKFSAQHMTLLKVFETIIYFAYNISLKRFFKNDEENEENEGGEEYKSIMFYIQIIGFLLLLFASLIHNELVIINTPSLKAKTEYYLDKDADKEQCSSYYSDTLFTNSKETSSTVTNLYSDLTGSDIS